MDALTDAPAATAFEALPLPAIVVDASQRVLQANEAGTRLLGDRVVGRSFADCVGHADRSVHDQHVRRLAESPESRQWALQLGQGEGTQVRIHGAADPATGHLVLLIEQPDEGDSPSRRQQQLADQQQLRSLTARLIRLAEEERRRVARDLHDGLGEALSLLELKTDTLAASQLDTRQQDLVAEVRALLDDVGHQVSTMVFRLSPPVLRQVGLAAAVRWLGEQLQRDTGLAVAVEERDVPALSQELRGFLFRAVRELLHNTAKHADAASATVRLRGRTNWLDVEVADEGRGFDVEVDVGAVGDGGFGLFSLREEVSYLGGSCDIRSAPDRGTRVLLGVPVEAGP